MNDQTVSDVGVDITGASAFGFRLADLRDALGASTGAETTVGSALGVCAFERGAAFAFGAMVSCATGFDGLDFGLPAFGVAALTRGALVAAALAVGALTPLDATGAVLAFDTGLAFAGSALFAAGAFVFDVLSGVVVEGVDFAVTVLPLLFGVGRMTPRFAAGIVFRTVIFVGVFVAVALVAGAAGLVTLDLVAVDFASVFTAAVLGEGFAVDVFVERVLAAGAFGAAALAGAFFAGDFNATVLAGAAFEADGLATAFATGALGLAAAALATVFLAGASLTGGFAVAVTRFVVAFTIASPLYLLRHASWCRTPSKKRSALV